MKNKVKPTDLVEVRLADISQMPGNPNNGDVELIGESYDRWGELDPIVVNRRTMHILAGNHRYQAMLAAGEDKAAVVMRDVPEADELLASMSLNKIADAGYGKDDEALMLEALKAAEDYYGTGYNDEMVAEMERQQRRTEALTDANSIPPVPKKADAISKRGDVWLLGKHRVMCGDSTSAAELGVLLAGAVVDLIHADPPYGMGKEKDGVLNDNLYETKLDAFQMDWLSTWRAQSAENASAYIWGNAPDLWRLWWTRLSPEREFTVRNEIVWDKATVPSMHSAEMHSYPIATERCLFLMRGQQFLGNQNQEDYWEGYEPLRAWLAGEVAKMGWSKKEINLLTESHMANHWLSKSQFQPINAKAYNTLRDAAAGQAFRLTYDELYAELFPDVKSGGNEPRRSLSAAVRESRSYFDNAHDNMTDVWRFERVSGEERYGHATPKPVEMVERALLSSTPECGRVGAPFGGTGPEVIAAERTGRLCYAMELEPRYVDVICRRFQEHTGVAPVLEATGESHDFTATEQALAV